MWEARGLSFFEEKSASDHPEHLFGKKLLGSVESVFALGELSLSLFEKPLFTGTANCAVLVKRCEL